MMIDVRRALMLSFGERYALMAVALLGSVFIARLLTPQEIGIYSVSLALIGIAQVVRDFGVGSFLIQEKNLSKEHIRTAFTFMILIGSALFVLTFFSAPLVARYYAESRLIETIRISSINFLILPFCSISLSLLRREMAFDRLIVVNLVAALTGLGTTLTLAYRGFGPNSMAFGAVASNIVTGAGAWLARSEHLVLTPGLKHWRSILRFGTQTSATSIVTTISMDINDLAVGKILGFAPVAIISRGQGLMNLFNRDLMGAIRNVAYPAFAKAYRENIDLEAHHASAVAMITALAWPFYAFISLYALELLRLLFGPQWDAAAPLVPWFCLGGAVAATYNLVLPMLIARGRIDLATRIDLVTQPIRAVTLVVGVIVSQSMEIFAILFALVSALSAPYVYYIKSKCQKTDGIAMTVALKKSLLVTVLCMAAPLVISYHWSNVAPADNIILITAAGALFVASWMMAIVIVGHPLLDDPLCQKAMCLLKLQWLIQK